MATFKYLKNVSTLALDETKCTGCGMCMNVCPHDVFQRSNGSVVIRDADDCMECGACSMNCPQEAIYVKKGVGCAAAIINAALGRSGSACCCVVEDGDGSAAPTGRKDVSCC